MEDARKISEGGEVKRRIKQCKSCTECRKDVPHGSVGVARTTPFQIKADLKVYHLVYLFLRPCIGTERSPFRATFNVVHAFTTDVEVIFGRTQRNLSNLAYSPVIFLEIKEVSFSLVI